MPNKVYLEYKVIERTNYKAGHGVTVQGTPRLTDTRTFEISLTSDITIEAASEWSTLSGLLPDFLSKTLKLMTTFSSLGGGISKNFAELTNKLELPFWTGSPPAKVNVQLGFFTKTDAYIDVFEPVKEIVGLSILTRDPSDNSRFITPGINLRNFNEVGKDDKSKTTRTGKIVSFEIPGVIYLPYAIIESARPTFSNEVTESSYPLWATIELNIMGVGPASTDMFTEAENSPNKFNKVMDYAFGKILSEGK